MYQKLKGNRKGFTLAELLIVIAIIAILAAIAIPVYTTQMGKARARVNQANIRSAQSVAQSDYMLDDTKNTGRSYTFTVANGNMTIASESAGTTTGTGITTVVPETADTTHKSITVYIAVNGTYNGYTAS